MYPRLARFSPELVNAGHYCNKRGGIEDTLVWFQKIDWLVVGFYPSEKYEFDSWGYDFPNIWKNKTCSKPPTSWGLIWDNPNASFTKRAGSLVPCSNFGWHHKNVDWTPIFSRQTLGKTVRFLLPQQNLGEGVCLIVLLIGCCQWLAFFGSVFTVFKKRDLKTNENSPFFWTWNSPCTHGTTRWAAPGQQHQQPWNKSFQVSGWLIHVGPCWSTLPLISHLNDKISKAAWFTGWWFQPLWKILVNGKDYPIYYGK